MRGNERGGLRVAFFMPAVGDLPAVRSSAARAALERGRGVIYLVPEIGLTPLLVNKIRRRFPEQVALLHSGMPARRRLEAWEAVRRGEARLVVSRDCSPLPGDRPLLLPEPGTARE